MITQRRWLGLGVRNPLRQVEKFQPLCTLEAARVEPEPKVVEGNFRGLTNKLKKKSKIKKKGQRRRRGSIVSIFASSKAKTIAQSIPE